MFPSVTPARLARLCMKELRESLRDRRTIVTLVLMPLLVYPLLSLVLNRVLLTGVSNTPEVTVRYGIGNELKDGGLETIMTVGYGLLQDPELSPVFVDEMVRDKRTDNPLSELESESSLPIPELLVLKDNGREALSNASVDVVIVRKAMSDDENTDVNDDENETEQTPSSGRQASENSDAAAGNSASAGVAQIVDQLKRFGSLPPGFDPSVILKSVGTYEVRYRQGDPQSERAVQLLERMLAAVNNEASSMLISAEYRAPYRLRATPVVMKSNYADLLATMVPLVLVLMTMAGAVYPAIDLTAGERERGTMESLIVSPTPTAIILLAKYSAVVTVALLTALANLGAMTITLWVSGIGRMVFGEATLSPAIIGTVLLLLVLFTMFFAALLLAITSFAKSFKEAQAYLIPLMLLALTPGVMSLLPGIRFTPLLATVPLVNIVLLAREVLVGAGEWNTGLIAVICNGIYALAALAMASRLFGSDASMQGSKGSWRDLVMRPSIRQLRPTVDQMALSMAVLFPLYFIVSSSLSSLSSDLETGLWISAAASFLLILGTPIFACWYRNISMSVTFRLARPGGRNWALWAPALLVIAGTAWTMAHEIFVIGQWLGIGTISLDQFDRVAVFQERLKEIPLWTILVALAFTPAVCEEIFFRGFVLSSLSKFSHIWAIVISSLLFGLMHVLTSNVLAIERFLPTTFIGILLGYIAVRTGSIWPGMLVHALHNGLLLSLGYFEEQVESWQILVNDGEHLPVSWLIGGAVLLVAAFSLLRAQTKGTKEQDPNDPSVQNIFAPDSLDSSDSTSGETAPAALDGGQ